MQATVFVRAAMANNQFEVCFSIEFIRSEGYTFPECLGKSHIGGGQSRVNLSWPIGLRKCLFDGLTFSGKRQCRKYPDQGCLLV